MENNSVLNDEELNKVAGGKSEPDEYLYKARLIEGVRVKTEPDIKAEDVCVAQVNTVVFVLKENCGYDFVYCVFKGDKHREYGYIRSEHLARIN